MADALLHDGPVHTFDLDADEVLDVPRMLQTFLVGLGALSIARQHVIHLASCSLEHLVQKHGVSLTCQGLALALDARLF